MDYQGHEFYKALIFISDSCTIVCNISGNSQPGLVMATGQLDQA